jgi:mannose-6-phosphate isomerase-like protein (cupin superfamily)
MAGWRVAQLQELEEWDDGRCPYRPVRHHLGITTFGATTWTARAAGDRVINEHDETDPTSGDELYLVLSGRARFELDGEPVPAPTGTFVRVEAGVKRTAFAEEAGTTILAVGGAAEGKVYEPEGWEVIAPLVPLFEARQGDEVIRRLTSIIEEGPTYAAVYYCLACAESLTGDTEAAVGHLRTAVELRPEFGEFARGDDDFVAIRDDERFAEITG